MFFANVSSSDFHHYYFTVKPTAHYTTVLRFGFTCLNVRSCNPNEIDNLSIFLHVFKIKSDLQKVKS